MLRNAASVCTLRMRKVHEFAAMNDDHALPAA
jgi:hypothetical protein